MLPSKSRQALFAVSALCLLTAFVAIPFWGRGQPLVGLRYSVSSNNAVALGPNTVTSTDGRRITLNDGRILELPPGESLAYFEKLLKESAGRVRYEADGLLYLQKTPVVSCAPVSEGLLFTIPLIKLDFPTHTDSGFVAARLLPPELIGAE